MQKKTKRISGRERRLIFKAHIQQNYRKLLKYEKDLGATQLEIIRLKKKYRREYDHIKDLHKYMQTSHDEKKQNIKNSHDVYEALYEVFGNRLYFDKRKNVYTLDGKPMNFRDIVQKANEILKKSGYPVIKGFM